MDLSSLNPWFCICCEEKTAGTAPIAEISLDTQPAIANSRFGESDVANNEYKPVTLLADSECRPQASASNLNDAPQEPEALARKDSVPQADSAEAPLLPICTVTVDKTGAKNFGASFDITDPQRPVLIKILPDSALGKLVSLNSQRSPQVGSALVAVNNKLSKGSDMVRALRTSGPLSATFKAPRIAIVSIPEGEGPLGLGFFRTSDLGLFVKSSMGRAASAGVQARDFIIAVNGEKKNADEMFDILSTSKHVELEIWSYNEESRQRTVIIPKGDGGLGLELMPIPEGDNIGLKVVNVSGRAAASGVRIWDTIVAVNGLAKNPKELFEDLQQPCELKLLISTPAS